MFVDVLLVFATRWHLWVISEGFELEAEAELTWTWWQEIICFEHQSPLPMKSHVSTGVLSEGSDWSGLLCSHTQTKTQTKWLETFRNLQMTVVTLLHFITQWHLLHISTFINWLSVSVWKWAADLLFPLFVSLSCSQIWSSDSGAVSCSLRTSAYLPSPAHLTPHESESDLVEGFTAAERSLTTRPTANRDEVGLCVPAAPVEGLQGLRATCRRLIVQTGEVQTVPDIQHEDMIKMTPFSHSFIKTKNQNKATVKVGLVGFLKALPLETKSLPKQTDPMKTSVEESLTWKNNSRRLKTNEQRLRGFSYQTADSSVLRLFQCRQEESRTPRVVQMFQTMTGFKDRMRSAWSQALTADSLPAGGSVEVDEIHYWPPSVWA